MWIFTITLFVGFGILFYYFKMATGDEDVRLLLTTLLRKELIKKPPIFSDIVHRGLDISNHFSKMDHFFKAINVSDESTEISMLLTMMSTRNFVVKPITPKAKIMVGFVID